MYVYSAAAANTLFSAPPPNFLFLDPPLITHIHKYCILYPSNAITRDSKYLSMSNKLTSDCLEKEQAVNAVWAEILEMINK